MAPGIWANWSGPLIPLIPDDVSVFAASVSMEFVGRCMLPKVLTVFTIGYISNELSAMLEKCTIGFPNDFSVCEWINNAQRRNKIWLFVLVRFLLLYRLEGNTMHWDVKIYCALTRMFYSSTSTFTFNIWNGFNKINFSIWHATRPKHFLVWLAMSRHFVDITRMTL